MSRFILKMKIEKTAVKIPQRAIALVIGIVDPIERIDKIAETMVPIKFVINPWSVEAVPALSGKGSRHAETVCGHRKAKPTTKLKIGPITDTGCLKSSKAMVNIKIPDTPITIDPKAINFLGIMKVINLSVSKAEMAWESTISENVKP